MSSTTELDTFVALSALLTGIAADKLAPQLDPTDVKTAYFNTAKQQDAGTLGDLLSIFSEAKQRGDSDEQIATLIFEQSGDEVAWFARSVMLEWYLATWYDPGELQRCASKEPPQVPSSGTVISATAYTQGWAWSVAQAHPMGYSTLRFGYWAQQPPSLSDFVGGGES